MAGFDRTTLTATTLAALLGVGAGWLGAARPWEDDRAGPASSPDGSSTVVLTDTATVPESGYRFQQWWSDGDSVLSLFPTADGLGVARDRARMLEAPPWHFTQPDRVRPQSVAALPGSLNGPWVAIGDTASASGSGQDQPPSLRSWSGQWSSDVAPGEDWTPQPTESMLPAAPARVSSSDSILSASVAVAKLGGTPAAVAFYRQGREGTETPRTQGLAMCPDARDCVWDDELATPEGEPPLEIASTGTGFVLVTDGPTARVWFSDDTHLRWREIGAAPGGAQLEAAVDGADGVLLLWRRSPPAAERVDPETGDAVSASPSDPGPDHLTVQRVSSSGSIDDVVAALPLPADTGRLTCVAHLGDEWLVGGAITGTSDWEDMPYSPAQALLLRAGDEAWEDVTPEVLRHQPDETVQALYRGVDGQSMITMASGVQRTWSTWEWRPTDESSAPAHS